MNLRLVESVVLNEALVICGLIALGATWVAILRRLRRRDVLWPFVAVWLPWSVLTAYLPAVGITIALVVACLPIYASLRTGGE